MSQQIYPDLKTRDYGAGLLPSLIRENYYEIPLGLNDNLRQKIREASILTYSAFLEVENLPKILGSGYLSLGIYSKGEGSFYYMFFVVPRSESLSYSATPSISKGHIASVEALLDLIKTEYFPFLASITENELKKLYSSNIESIKVAYEKFIQEKLQELYKTGFTKTYDWILF